ncbi:MAG: cobalamin biosynthesis protein CobQ, partial [Candidatus Levybacteria bacterium]|nr:cobalamin biosynthesis protein CobQ [Candidatus Levybacteria bacterium]
MSKRPTTNDYQLTIGWLYPELMSTYGDRGNIIVLQKRCEWRGIKVEVKKLEIGYSAKELNACDLLFMGGAQDKQQKIVSEDLRKKADILSAMIEDGTPGLYICGAYQFLGKYYKEADGTVIDGLGIFDLYTENPGENHPRLIGNIVTELGIMNQELGKRTLVGFENHGGRTHLGKNIKPFTKVISGFGNNGTDKTEGAVYKNSFGSYMHGPILPKNPHFADHLLTLALRKKYGKEICLADLDDSLEWQAH